MFIKISTILLALTAGLALPGCGKQSATESNVEAIEQSDSIPEGVKRLVRALADNDTDSFAEMVSYPLQRPYPLHDIHDAAQMKKYYREMVDDSLRNAIIKSRPGQWKDHGWRGWSLEDGHYIWIDETVYDVQYISQKELRKIDSLTNEEVKSINPRISDGWRPVLCLRDRANGRVYRIDTRTKNKENTPHLYRLAMYGDNADLRGLPALLLEGVMESEGSAGTVLYRFQDKEGKELILEPDAPDSGYPILIEPNDSVIELNRAYWHELINTPRQ